MAADEGTKYEEVEFPPFEEVIFVVVVVVVVVVVIAVVVKGADNGDAKARRFKSGLSRFNFTEPNSGITHHPWRVISISAIHQAPPLPRNHPCLTWLSSCLSRKI